LNLDTRTKVIICAVVQSERDSRFAFDAVKWARALSAYGIPDENIVICGSIPVYTPFGVLANIEDTEKDCAATVGLTSTEFMSLFKKYWKKSLDIVAEIKEVETSGKYDRLTLVLNNHGAIDGCFGGEKFQIRRADIAHIVSSLTIPTLVMSSSCFAVVLFQDLAISQDSSKHVLRIFDGGQTFRYSYCWGKRLEAYPTRFPLGTFHAYYLLEALDKSASYEDLIAHLNSLHSTAMPNTKNNAVMIRVEGDMDLLRRNPFFGSHLQPGRFPSPQNELSPIPSEQNVDSSGLPSTARLWVSPALEKLLDSLPLPTTFWDECYDEKIVQQVIAEKRTEDLFLLGDALREKGLISSEHPGAYTMFVVIHHNMTQQFLQALLAYKKPEEVILERDQGKD